MLRSESAPWTKYHNIVGVVEQDWPISLFAETGDGVVAFESAHREDFGSEIVVEADHVTVHAHPRSILEVRRILLDHLADMNTVPSRGVIPAAYYDPNWPQIPPTQWSGASVAAPQTPSLAR